jgi:CRP-like cAMP-binding protein
MSTSAQKKPAFAGNAAAGNSLLAALPAEELRVLEGGLEYVRLASRRVLYEPGEPIRHLVFPTAGIVSLLHATDSGESAELTVVGREGMVGAEALLGADAAPSRALVQAAGFAYRLRVTDAREAFARGGRFQALMLRVIHALILQLSQTALCNLNHLVEQQLCRWLLLCLDRLEGNDIRMTHESIAGMLGVRRQGVTEAARKLQEQGIIRRARGCITVLDRGRLDQRACDCYRLLMRQTRALFAEPAPRKTR